MSVTWSHCERARGSRPAGGHFLLLAQKKVTKEEGLNTDLTGSSGYNPRTTSVQRKRSLAADATHPRKSVPGIEPVWFVGCCHVSETNRISPFALATLVSANFAARSYRLPLRNIWGRK
jgi:hypothetical protein